MDVQDSIEEYRAFCRGVARDDVDVLVRICRMLYLPQKTVATALFIFFSAKKDIRIEPDDVVLQSACVNMACRVCETHRPTDKIFEYASYQHALGGSPELRTMYIESINRTELDICVVLDFDFEMPDFYGKLESVCREMGLPPSYSRRCWVFLNDILMRPVSIFFTVQEIVLGCMLVEFVAAKKREGASLGEAPEAGEVEGNEGFLSVFAEQAGVVDADRLALEFVALEVCEMYESGCH